VLAAQTRDEKNPKVQAALIVLFILFFKKKLVQLFQFKPLMSCVVKLMTFGC